VVIGLIENQIACVSLLTHKYHKFEIKRIKNINRKQDKNRLACFILKNILSEFKNRISLIILIIFNCNKALYPLK
jgi:hypothetical protein